MNYRKAMFSDIDDISYLVTDLLGTCNINKNNISISKIDILNNNKKEIIKDINNYYVCEDNNHIIGACGISNLKHNNDYDLLIKEYREILYLVVDSNYQKKV